MRNPKSLLIICFLLLGSATVQAQPSSSVFPEDKSIYALLDQTENQIDLARTKLTIDKIIDPSIDVEHNLKKIDEIVEQIRVMLSNNPTSKEKMLAIKKYLYEAGPWNDFHIYQYDFDDPVGAKITNKLLPNYMASRRVTVFLCHFCSLSLDKDWGLT